MNERRKITMNIFEMITEADLNILDMIQDRTRSGFGDIFFSYITEFGDGGILWILIAAMMLFTKRTRTAGIVLLFALAFTSSFGVLVLKPAVSRLRPFVLTEFVNVFITPPGGFSFPSGHTITSAAAAVCVYKADRRAGIAAIITASLVAYSRMYFYVHYPTDILAGLIIGTAAAAVMMRLARPLNNAL